MLIENGEGVDKTSQIVVAIDLFEIEKRKSSNICIALQKSIWIIYRHGLFFDLSKRELRSGAGVEFRPAQDGKVLGYFLVHSSVESL